MRSKPVVCIPADNIQVEGADCSVVLTKYIDAVTDGAGVLPWIWPCAGQHEEDLEQLLDQVDGILLPGSHSNVEPHHYDGPVSRPGTLHDPKRDAATLPLIRKAVALGVPLLGICRGFQEINVAMGGVLHQHIHEQESMMDHREDYDIEFADRYDPAHELYVEPGGILEQLVGMEVQCVNSLHAQGIDRLGGGLRVEARASDGLIEAFSMPSAKALLLAVQWHPEWEPQQHNLYKALFSHFIEACHLRSISRAL